MPELHTHNEVFEFSLSDPFMTYPCIDVPKVKRQHKSVRCRSYKHFDEQSYVEGVMNSLVFCGIANSDKNQGNTEKIWSEWKAEFLRISNKHAPIKVSRVKNRYNPWMNSDIINLMYERDFIHKKQGRRIVPHYGRSIDFLGIRWLVVSMTPRKHT